MLRVLLVVLALLPLTAGAQRNLAVSSAPASGEQRVALVIGNASYKDSPLRNPVNDARAMAVHLQNIGFVVIKRENLTSKQIGPALREFRSRLSSGAVAVFFYAGHGLQVRGINYLPTVDAEIEAEEDVPTQAMDLNKVLDLMEESKTRLNLVFLDSCRNNPFTRKFRSTATGGLAKVDAASGTLISFATRPGSVAADGDGKNGLFTEHLLKQMDVPGLPIEQMLKRVGAGVKLASKGRQDPWIEGRIDGEFFFRAAGQQAAAPTGAPAPAPTFDPAAIELALWESVKDSKSADELSAYLEQYPKGRFAGVARARLKALSPAPQPVSAPATKTAPPAPQLAAVAPTVQSLGPAVSTRGPRLALLIGNSGYNHGTLPRLKTPTNDATDIAEALRQHGFSTTLVLDANYLQMRQTIDKFGESLRAAGPQAVGLFYFAGHGVEYEYRNYLVPIGTSISNPKDLEFDTVDAARILAYMEDAKNIANIVILDACRDNPFPRFRSVGTGLGVMRAPMGFFIALAAAPGQKAIEGDGRNSLFAEQFLESLKQPVSSIDTVFLRVTAAVANKTSRQQVPWKQSSLTQNFFFRPDETGR